MEYTQLPIPGVWLLRPHKFQDARGYFMETYSQRDFEAHIGRHVEFVQDNQSSSHRGVVRGMHFQLEPWAQSKLVRCIHGRVLDIAVDIRQDSPTFGRHVAVELDDLSGVQLFLPRGMAHGFTALTDTAVFQYKCDNYYHPEAESGFSAFDPALKLPWPYTREQAGLSQKDAVRPTLAEILPSLNFHYDETF